MSIADTVLSVRRSLLKLIDKLAFLAPFLLRITVGVVFVVTGWGKLHNLEQVTKYFGEELHIPMPALNAAVSAGTEFFGGILMILGLGVRLAALPMAFTMVVAILTAKRDELDGFASLLRFDEWAYLVMFLVLALIGAGALSLDALIARRLGATGAPKSAHPMLEAEPSVASQG